MDRAANLYSFLDGLNIDPRLDVGLNSESLSSGGIAIGDEVVHDKVVDVTSDSPLATSTKQTEWR